MANDIVPVDPFTIPQKNWVAGSIGNFKRLLESSGTESDKLTSWLQTILSQKSILERQNYNIIEEALRAVRPRRADIDATDTTTTGTAFAISCDTINYQDDLFFTVGSSVINVPFTGYYMITLKSVFSAAGAAGNYRRVWPHGIITHQHVGTTNEVTIHGVSTQFYERGDTFACNVSQDTGGNLAVTSNIQLMASRL